MSSTLAERTSARPFMASHTPLARLGADLRVDSFLADQSVSRLPASPHSTSIPATPSMNARLRHCVGVERSLDRGRRLPSSLLGQVDSCCPRRLLRRASQMGGIPDYCRRWIRTPCRAPSGNAETVQDCADAWLRPRKLASLDALPRTGPRLRSTGHLLQGYRPILFR